MSKIYLKFQILFADLNICLIYFVSIVATLFKTWVQILYFIESCSPIYISLSHSSTYSALLA